MQSFEENLNNQPLGCKTGGVKADAYFLGLAK